MFATGQGVISESGIERQTQNQQDISALYPELSVEARGSRKLLDLKVRTERVANTAFFMQSGVDFPGGNVYLLCN